MSLSTFVFNDILYTFRKHWAHTDRHRREVWRECTVNKKGRFRLAKFRNTFFLYSVIQLGNRLSVKKKLRFLEIIVI